MRQRGRREVDRGHSPGGAGTVEKRIAASASGEVPQGTSDAARRPALTKSSLRPAAAAGAPPNGDRRPADGAAPPSTPKRLIAYLDEDLGDGFLAVANLDWGWA